MDVAAGFHEFEPQGPFLEHIGPIQVRDSEDGPVFGLRAEPRHTDHRGTIQGGLLSTFADFRARASVERVGGTLSFADVSLTVEEREVVRAGRSGSWPVSRAPRGRRRGARTPRPP